MKVLPLPRGAALGLTLCVLLGACSTGPKLSSDPQVAACQRGAQSAQPRGMDRSKLAHFTAQADAFAECMEQVGYQLDENEFNERLTYFRQVKASDVMYGDPSQAIATERQRLRLSPELWRKGT